MYGPASLVSAPEVDEAWEGDSALPGITVGGVPSDSVAILEQALAELPEALAAAGETTYVPWRDATLDTDDFIVVRLMEVVVRADDLAVSVGLPTPEFDDDVLHPALALLAMLGARRHGQDAAVRALSRAERATWPAAAF